MRDVSITMTTPSIDLELFKTNVNRIKNRIRNIRIISKI